MSPSRHSWPAVITSSAPQPMPAPHGLKMLREVRRFRGYGQSGRGGGVYVYFLGYFMGDRRIRGGILGSAWSTTATTGGEGESIRCNASAFRRARNALKRSLPLAYIRVLPIRCETEKITFHSHAQVPHPCGPGLKPARRGSPFGHSSAPTASAIAAPRITDDGPPALTDQRTPCNSTSAVEWSCRTTGRSRLTLNGHRARFTGGSWTRR